MPVSPPWIGLDLGGAAVKAGETFSSFGAATGPVGSMAWQTRPTRTARARSPLPGGAQKCALARETFGFDESQYYHRVPDFQSVSLPALPDRMTLYYREFGGAVLEAVLPLSQRFRPGIPVRAVGPLQ